MLAGKLNIKNYANGLCTKKKKKKFMKWKPQWAELNIKRFLKILQAEKYLNAPKENKTITIQTLKCY